MDRFFRFNARYFLLAVVLLAIEIYIGFRVHDNFVRPYVGDYLVVMLLYCMLMSCCNMRVIPAAILVLLFSYLIEWLQYLGLADKLGYTEPGLMRTILGSYFTWTDIWAYTLGIATVIAIEYLLQRKRRQV